MKNFSNTYIFVFSSIMVTAVAAILSVIALLLQPRQNQNIRVEQIQNILSSVQIESTKQNAEDLFNQYITESYVIKPDGEIIENLAAFDVNLKEEVSKIDKIKNLQAKLTVRQISPFKSFLASLIKFKEVDKEEIHNSINKIKETRELPVYLCKKDNQTYYVFPLRGKGLWGPIWGYISLKDDLNTVYGAVFDHKGETPGLGAEISQSWFETNFNGKKLFTEAYEFSSVKVVKGGADKSNPYEVDAISGGTITSKGLEKMIYDCMIDYVEFVELKRN